MSFKVKFDSLFKIYDPQGSRAFMAHFGSTSADAFAYSRGECIPVEPIPVTWFMGSKTPSDVIWSSLVHPLVVSNRVIEVLTESGISGWSTYAVQVFNGEGTIVPGYVGLASHGRCAAQDLSESKIILKKYTGGWSPEFLGHFFPPESWDGTDLFMEHPHSTCGATSYRFATERLVRALKKAKITNLKFTPLNEIQISAAHFEIGCRDMLPANYQERVMTAYESAGVAIPEHVLNSLTNRQS